MELPEKIAGLDARRMRAMFKSFTALKSEMDWNNGTPIVKVRQMTPDYIAEQLEITFGEAHQVQKALVAEKWIEAGKFTPTRKGWGCRSMSIARSYHAPRQKP